MPFESVSELNYLVNISELNLAITLLNNQTGLYEDTKVKEMLVSINERMEALVQRDPREEYYNTKSILLNYLGDEENSLKAISDSVKVKDLKRNLVNMNKLQYKLKYGGKLCPVEFYK